jgi:hypothetical protein
MGRPGAAIGIDRDVGNDGLEAAHQVISELCQALCGFRLLGDGKLHRAAEGNRAGHVFGPWADPELLAATMKDRFDGLSIADDERADSLRRANLVS